MIAITDQLAIDESLIQVRFVQASGPGGQNVNKVASKAQLRFDVQSAALPEDVRARLVRLAGKRLTEDGFLLIEAGRYRTQEQNREDALQRLVALIRQAARKPRPRRPTRPSQAARQARMESKRRRSDVKRLRRRVED